MGQNKIMDRRRLKNGLMICMALFLLSAPVLAASSNDSFTPSFKEGMKDLPDTIKDSMNRIINWGMVALVALAVIYTLYHGISAIVDGKRGDASGRSGHITNVFVGVGMLILVGAVITLINYVIK